MRLDGHKTWVHGAEAGNSETFSIEVPTVSVGRFAVDSIDPYNPPRLEILDGNCQSLGSADGIEHIDISDATVEVAFRRPGTYRLRVSSVESTESLGSFDLSGELVPALVEDHWYSVDSDGLMARWSEYRTVGIEEKSREEEVDPDPDTATSANRGAVRYVLTLGQTTHSREEEVDPDPDTTFGPGAGAMDRSREEEVDPDPDTAFGPGLGFVDRSREEEVDPDPDTAMSHAVLPLASVVLERVLTKSREEEVDPDPDTILASTHGQDAQRWTAIFMVDAERVGTAWTSKSREEEVDPDPDTLRTTSEWVRLGVGSISERADHRGVRSNRLEQHLGQWLAELLELTPPSARKGPERFELLSFAHGD